MRELAKRFVEMLDALLAESVFVESAMPIVRIRILGRGAGAPLSEWTWDPHDGPTEGRTKAPTCVVELDDEAAASLLDESADAATLLDLGRLRIGGLGDDFIVLMMLSEPLTLRRAFDAGRARGALSTRQRVALAERAKSQLASTLGNVPPRIDRMLSDWARRRIARCIPGCVTSLSLPELPLEPWLAVDDQLDALCAASFDALRAEAEALVSGRIRAPHYGRRLDEADAPAGANPRGWRHWNLIQDFRALPERQEPFPVASELISRIAAIRTVMVGGFLLLEPGVEIAAHSDGAGWAVSQQLGLIVPDGCDLTVAWEQRMHAEGRSLRFNDSFIHKAANRSASHRVLFSVTYANPLLDEAERRAIAELWAIMPGRTLALYDS